MADGGDWRASPIRVWILGPGLDDLSFDATVRESHSSELEVTENPVETGVVIADHAFMKPLRLEIEGRVSDTPLHSNNADPFASTTKRSARAMELLQNLQASATPFIVQTGLRAYPDMLLVSLTSDQDAGNAGAYDFRASLRQIITSDTQEIAFPPRKPGKPARQAAKPKDGGEKKAEAITDPKKRVSILSSLAKKLANGEDINPEQLSNLLPGL
jgi:hypothetical protein